MSLGWSSGFGFGIVEAGIEGRGGIAGWDWVRSGHLVVVFRARSSGPGSSLGSSLEKVWPCPLSLHAEGLEWDVLEGM